MTDDPVRPLRSGANQSGVRNHNERLLLSMIQRHGNLPGSELARRSGLSQQTVSVILRKLDREELLSRGQPQRGRVGKPSIPIGLAPDGVFSLGLKIGRRSADLLLMDFHGEIREQLHTTFRYPMPDTVFEFLETGLQTLSSNLSQRDQSRICGIGVAAPFEIWNWHESVGAPSADLDQWKSIDFKDEVSKFTDLPVFVQNDATSACIAEHVYGRGKEFCDYAYFFVGAFIGGGIVLNHSVFLGNQGNAGAFGPLRSIGPDGTSNLLLDTASIYLLEAELEKAGLDREMLWTHPQDWSELTDFLKPWIKKAGAELAAASMSACSVIDFEAILIDGAFPPYVREMLVDEVSLAIQDLDSRGLIIPQIENGTVGGNARAIGAACAPILAKYFLDSNVGLSG